MTARELSPVFSGGVKPVHRGLYRREFVDGWWYAHWGKFWGVASKTKSTAMANANLRSPNQSLPWQGLAEKP